MFLMTLKIYHHHSHLHILNVKHFVPFFFLAAARFAASYHKISMSLHCTAFYRLICFYLHWNFHKFHFFVLFFFFISFLPRFSHSFALSFFFCLSLRICITKRKDKNHFQKRLRKKETTTKRFSCAHLCIH